MKLAPTLLPEPIDAEVPVEVCGHWRTERFCLALFVVYVTGILLLLKYVIPLEKLIEGIAQLGPWGPVLFVALYLVRGFIYFPGGAFLIASGVLFRQPEGAAIYLTGVILSASLSHSIGRVMHARRWFPRLRHRFEDPALRARIQAHGYQAIFMIHLLGLSFDIPNYLSGYLRMSYWRFIATVAGVNLIVLTVFQIIVHLTGVH